MGQVFSFPQKFTSRFSGKLSTAKNSLKLPTKEPSMLKTLGQGLKNNNLRSTTCTSVALNRQKHFLSESISFYPGPRGNLAHKLLHKISCTLAGGKSWDPRNIFNDLKNLKPVEKMKYGRAKTKS